MMLAYHQINGEFDESERIVAMAAPWVADPTLTPSYRALWLLQLAHFRDKQGNDVEALKIYDQSQAIANENALMLPPLRIFAHLGRAIAALCAGDADTAEAERVRAEAYWTFARKLDRALDGAIRTWIAILRHEYEAARKTAREVVAGMDDFGPVWLRFGSRLLLAIAEVEADRDADVAPILCDRPAQLLEGTCLQHHIARHRRGRSLDPPASRRAGSRASLHRTQRRGPQRTPRTVHAAHASDLVVGGLRRRVAAGHRGRRCRGARSASTACVRPHADPPGWPWLFEVRTLGRFEVLREGQPLAFSRKVPKKTLALLKAIIALGGRSVSEQRLLDALWPDEEGDAGARALDATVLRLRTLARRSGGDRAARWQACRSMPSASGSTCSRSIARSRPPTKPRIATTTTPKRNPCSAPSNSTVAPSWSKTKANPGPSPRANACAAASSMRSRARPNAVKPAGDDTAAIALYMRGIDADPAIESFYQGLMRCYDRSGRRSEAIAAYQRLRQILSVTLGLQPSPSSERLYQAVKG